MEKYAKKITDMELKGQFIQDINALSYAWSPNAATLLRDLFFAKWDSHIDNHAVDAAAHFRSEWCNTRLGNWSRGHAPNSVVNTNGLEATNKVVKDELTFRQLMPVLDFLRKGVVWLQEQSANRDENFEGLNPNVLKFARNHTFKTKEWTQAHTWKVSTSKQIRYLPQLDIYVAVAPGVKGDLTDQKASFYATTFTECSRPTYDEYTTMFRNVFILRSDTARPEMFNCTCAVNAKEFTCTHSLGVALMKGILTPPREAEVKLLGRKRRRGRRPMAAPAWERMEFTLRSPIVHPQQDDEILLGLPTNLPRNDLAADLVSEVV